MSEALQEHRAQASYRRGTVMGLTAAEAFMLVAFILLTLLVFWRVAANEERERLLAENKRLSTALEGFSDPLAVADSLALQERFSALSPDEMEERLSLVEDEEIRGLARIAQSLPKEGLLELMDLSREGAVPGIRDKLADLTEIGLRPEEVETMREELAAALDTQHRLEEETAQLSAERSEIEDQLNEFKKTGFTPGEIQTLGATLDELGERQEGLARTGAEIAATIREKAGGRIAELGGRVLPDGDVIFPDAVLFDANSADIRPNFDALLQSFCRLWFETLYHQRDALDTVQVEGHASSEYGRLAPDQAFVRNLNLSQRRAAAVFGRCLAYGGNDIVTDWARTAMAAVGYSSSRAIVENGVENRSASRRVVFALEPKTEAQMTRTVLDSAADVQKKKSSGDKDEKQGPSSVPDQQYYRKLGYEPLVGQVTRVRDGDTIEVGVQPVRIQGLHAPEIGSEIGNSVRRFVVEMIEGETVSCWLSGEETYDRKVGVCFLNGQDVAASVIAAGFGRDCPAYSKGRYVKLETEKASKIGRLPPYCL